MCQVKTSPALSLLIMLCRGRPSTCVCPNVPFPGLCSIGPNKPAPLALHGFTMSKKKAATFLFPTRMRPPRAPTPWRSHSPRWVPFARAMHPTPSSAAPRPAPCPHPPHPPQPWHAPQSTKDTVVGREVCAYIYACSCA
jgi:hypothetical protein